MIATACIVSCSTISDSRTPGASGCRVARADRASRLPARRSATRWARQWRPPCCWPRPSSSKACCPCNCRATAPCICCWRNAPAASASADWRVTATLRRPARARVPGTASRRSDRHRQSHRDPGNRRRRAALSRHRAHRAANAWRESLQVYFENSEQLPTRLWLHADACRRLGHAAAKTAGRGDASAADADAAAAIDDAWRRVQLIGETLTSEELRTLADARNSAPAVQ